MSPSVAAYAKGLPHVAYVEENMFTCSQDTQDKIKAVVEENGLNRVVIAACTPRNPRTPVPGDPQGCGPQQIPGGDGQYPESVLLGPFQGA